MTKSKKIEKISTRMGKNYPEHYLRGWLYDGGVDVDSSELVNKINEIIDELNKREEGK